MTHERARTVTALVGGAAEPHPDTVDARRAQAPPVQIVANEPAAANSSLSAAAGSGITPSAGGWPGWARAQLTDAVGLAHRAPQGTNVATMLYWDWFSPGVLPRTLRDPVRLRPSRPLAGIYRAAHAGAGLRRTVGGLTVLARHDVVAADGWWRTWGERWMPPRSRAASVRVLFTPDPARLAAFVRTVTGALLESGEPWTLACAVSPRRMRRSAGAALQLPSAEALPAGLLDALAPLLLPVSPPLCRPLAPGAAVCVPPGNGMTFGEHRCHLVALALRHPNATPRYDPPYANGAQDPLPAIGAVFAAHGIDPAIPWRGRRFGLDRHPSDSASAPGRTAR